MNEYAPWKPPGSHEFKVGDRVRVKLNLECPGFAGALYGSDGQLNPHYPGYEGRIGTIIRVGSTLDIDGRHPIVVELDWIESQSRFDTFRKPRLKPWPNYAPNELELVNDEQ